MNFYNPYTGSKKKRTVRRIIIVIISVLVITGATIVYGNHLKEKARISSQEGHMGVGREEITAETESQIIIPPSEGESGSSESVKGECVMLGIVKTDDKEDSKGGLSKEFEKNLAAAAEDNTGVLIPLTGDDGYLLYNSDRAMEFSRLPVNPELPNMSDLSDAVARAKSLGLRVTAFIRSGVTLNGDDTVLDNGIAADSRIAADAADAGFDEIIIGSLVTSPEEITSDAAHNILRYLNQMTAAAGDAEVGLSLPQEVYLAPALSPQIELFTSRSVFLTMELTDEKSTVSNLNYICENLAGTLSVYNMRMLLSPATTDIGDDLVKKLKDVGHENYLYTRIPEVPVKDDDPDETEKTTESETTEG